MIQKINNIKKTAHPHSEEISKTIDTINKAFTSFLVLLNCLGLAAAFAASSRLAELTTNQYGDTRIISVPVNFFGYILDVESDFWASQLIVFVYIALIFVFITIILTCIKLFIIAVLKSKIHMLNSIYHTEQLTGLLLEKNCELPTGSPEVTPEQQNDI